MAKKDEPKKASMPVDIQTDEFHGMGGSYVVDPLTGKRTRVAPPDLAEAPVAETISTDPEVVTNEIK